ncbi:MAG: methyltransferase domain-containing protein [Chloroflexi bacterium]|nr:methyltransferase domain-containing protein [Chloroflexota bacterium]
MEASSDPNQADIPALQQTLVNRLKANNNLTTGEVTAAFLTIPRHPFLPDKPLDLVYKDEVIPTKFDDNDRSISSSSQPAMMAIMLEQLDLQPGQHVLEVGAGTGYNAALMGYLVGKHGRVTTIDLDEDTAEAAQEHLAAVGCTNVDVVCGDGMAGYAPHAPYDHIILTVGGWEIAPEWLAQLKPDGRLLLPLSLYGPQFAIAFERQEDHLLSVSIKPCGFMRLRGPNAGPNQSYSLGPDPGLHLGREQRSDAPETIDTEQIYAWLTGPSEEYPTGIQTMPRQIFRSLMLWLALHEPRLVDVAAHDELIDLVPYLLEFEGANPWRYSVGILGEDGLALLRRMPQDEDEMADGPRPFALTVRAYGTDKCVAQKLAAHIQNWDAAGRPDVKGMRVRVYPVAGNGTAGTPVLSAAEVAVTRRWHTFVVDWQE